MTVAALTPSPYSGAEGRARLCLTLATLGSLVARLSHQSFWDLLAALALLGFVVLDWSRVRHSGRLFMALAIVSALAALIGLPNARPVLLSALSQGLSFTALLVALATLRPAMQRSRLLAEAAAWLISRPQGQRYASVSFGGHFLALIFNVGVLQLIGDILAAAKLDFERHPSARHLLLGTMRGSSAIAIWSPLAMGFAVVVVAFPTLNPMAYIVTGLVLALGLLTLGCCLPRHGQAESLPLDVLPNARALVILLLGAAALLAVTATLYALLGLSFITATTLVVPLFAWAWLRLEPDAQGERAPAIALATQLSQLRNEMFIFASSTLIGALIATLFSRYGPQSMMSVDSFLVPMLTMVLIWGLAALSLPPSIPVVLLAQLLATTSIADAHSLSLALALSTGWALGMLVSPVSATLLIAARMAEVGGARIAWDWNRAYTFWALPLTTLALGMIYLIE